MPVLKSDFKPAWWLPGPHLQTLWPTFFKKRPELTLHTSRIELADGDFVEISSTPLDNKPVVLLLHGLEGSLSSHYAKPLIKHLKSAGYGVCFMHLRGCSDAPNRLPRSYHSGETRDLQAVVEYINNHLQTDIFGIIGFSLGGNILLKWLGEQGELAATKTAIAVSIPFQLEHAAERLEQGFSRTYQKYLISKCQHRYQQKFSTLDSPLDIDIEQLNTFYLFDDQVTAPLNGFKGADDYYQQCSSRQFIKNIRKPTLILHAKDDPFMWEYTPPDEKELSPSVDLELSEAGGHVGFIAGNIPFKAEYWLDTRIIEWLDKQLVANKLGKKNEP